MTADLHIHTTASDGQLSPKDVIENALKAGLSHIAITDHDTVAGLVGLCCDKSKLKGNLTIIPGIEFSTDGPNHEVHILGLNIDIMNKRLNEELDRLSSDRQARAKKMITKLNSLGYAIQYQRVVEISEGASAIGRPHIARALIEKGYFTQINEVFTVLLEKNGPAYIPHYKMDIKTVIAVIKSAGGTAVLAHPGLIGNDGIISEVTQAGIDGLEVYHPAHTREQINKYVLLAAQHNLLVSGGSDFHGIPGRYPEILGQFTIPAHFANKLCKNTAIK